MEETDATGRPVAAAKVSFQVPEEGPGGLFVNRLRTNLATTDAKDMVEIQVANSAGTTALTKLHFTTP